MTSKGILVRFYVLVLNLSSLTYVDDLNLRLKTYVVTGNKLKGWRLFNSITEATIDTPITLAEHRDANIKEISF